MLPLVHGHSRSSAVSTASAEHGASTYVWEGGPLREEPPGRVQPRPDTWLARQGCEVYLGTREQHETHEALPQGGLRLVLSLGDCMFLQGGLVQALYVLRSRPSSELNRRWYARSRCCGQGQGVRAGDPVRAPES